jgi:hypothetical protein
MARCPLRKWQGRAERLTSIDGGLLNSLKTFVPASHCVASLNNFPVMNLKS